MGCDPIFLGVEPEQQEYVAAGNVDLPVPIGVWEDKAAGIPLDLTGYTPRAAVRNVNTGTVTNATTVTLTMSSSNTDVLAIWSKATVETLSTIDPYIIDVAVDNGSTGDSFDLILGTVYFLKGASS